MRADERNTPSMKTLLQRQEILASICAAGSRRVASVASVATVRAVHDSLRKDCINMKVPVMLYRHSNGVFGRERVLNPCLKEIEFFRVMDPYTTFQEIAMFVGGVLAFPGAVMVTINDKDMAAKKGFGHKYAFRTEPTKKSKIRHH